MAAKPDVECLKNVGNQYITSKPPQYEKAIEAYTNALSIDPNHHAVLSNRSLAYYKLAKYEEALADADKAICVSPKWAKGYLRKCAALNALRRSREAQTVSEVGFQLMHSTSLCRDFVSQWLEACESLYRVETLPSLLPYGEAELCRVMISHWTRFRRESAIGEDVSFFPAGLVVVSEKYWQVLFRCLASRASPELAITHEQMQQHLSCISEEFERIVGLFGQEAGAVVKEWTEAIAAHVDPTSVEELSSLVSKKSSQLIQFLESDLHKTLYPIARSLFALAITVVTARTYALNSMNTGFCSISYVLRGCLFLFERSVLSTREYTALHLKVLTGHIDAYNRRYKPLSLSECDDLAQYCKKVESLLPPYASSHAWEYQQFCGAYERIVATAKGLILARKTGTAIPFQGLADQPTEMSVASALRDVEKCPTRVKSFAAKRLQEVINKPPRMVTLSDGQDLLYLTAVFMKLDDFDSAKNTLTTGEKIVLSLVGVHLQQGTLTLEEAPSTIGTLRQDVLMNAMLLKDMDPRLVTNVLIRWKSVFSEFRTVSIREGLGKTYLSTTASLRSLQTSGSLQRKHGEGSTVLCIAEEHKKKEVEFMKQHAFRCWSAVVECPRLLPVEKVLEPDELVVDFIHVAKYNKANLRASLQLCVLTITPSGEHKLLSIDSTLCNQLVKEWLKQLNSYAANGSNPETMKGLEAAGTKLSTTLFPPCVQQQIKEPVVKHVYIGLELYGALPIHLLPDKDGHPLFSHCTTSYINASRELIREGVLDFLAQQKKTSLQTKEEHTSTTVTVPVPAGIEASQHESKSTDKVQGSPRSTESDSTHTAQLTEQLQPLTSNHDCYIYADPNYDLELPQPSGGDTSVLRQFLDMLTQNLTLSDVRICEPLPSSLSEAHTISETIRSVRPELNIHIKSGDTATLHSVLQLQSPLLLHFCTHAFATFGMDVSQSSDIVNSKTGLVLAGFNTYRAQRFSYIDRKASTGVLNPSAINGLDLANTRLVFLSTCVSAVGTSVMIESANSLANAFRVAGALTVIATMWNIPDESTTHFVRHFYDKLFLPGVRPSEALGMAREKLCKDPRYTSLQDWAGFACYGEDVPLFPNSSGEDVQ